LPPEALEQATRLAAALARRDRHAFASLLLNLDLTSFHRNWLDFQDTHPRSILLAPRGHGKTTVADILYVLWRVLSNPNLRVLIISNTLSQSKAFLREISAHLIRPEIMAVWGDVRGERWTETEIELSRSLIAKEPTITAAGAGGAIISRHYDLIICDDIVDEENSSSALQRDKVRTWFFKTLLPCLEPQGEIHIIGTRWHYADLYGELTHAGWPTRIDRALREDGSALWPERFSAADLNAARTAAGARIFNCQYQNDPSGYEGAIFKYPTFRFHDYSTRPPALKVFAAADLAISQSQTADYFAFVAVGLDDAGNIYVLESFRDRLTFAKQVDFILARASYYSPLRVGIEAVAYQQALAGTPAQGAHSCSPTPRLKGQGHSSLEARHAFRGRPTFSSTRGWRARRGTPPISPRPPRRPG